MQQDSIFLGRLKELNQLQEFLSEDGSGFIYLRGRRRVGKSWLLEKLYEKADNCFLFTGYKDEGSNEMLTRFAKQWSEFSGDTSLTRIQKNLLRIDDIFDSVTQLIQAGDKQVALIFDEIQWLAKRNLGFAGSLKKHWVRWELSGKAKIIICGSSNRFFHDFQGGEEKILRGLKTHASIWLKPFSLGQIKKYFFPKYSYSDVLLVNLLLGGVPYYLKKLNPELPLMHAVNEALFSSKTIFLEEINELLRLEFNNQGTESIKIIMSHLGINGRTAKQIVELTGFSIGHISESLNQLVDYQLLYSKYPMFQKKQKNNAGLLYYLRDPFMNCYFSILRKLKQSIIMNHKNGLLFSLHVVGSKSGYYIPDFSGKAFEYMIWNILESLNDCDNNFCRKLLLSGQNYQTGTFWNKNAEIDLLLYSEDDRLLRLIECKWTNSIESSVIKDLKHKELVLKDSLKNNPKFKNLEIKKYIISAHTDKLNGQEPDVEFIGQKDLFWDVD